MRLRNGKNTSASNNAIIRAIPKLVSTPVSSQKSPNPINKNGLEKTKFIEKISGLLNEFHEINIKSALKIRLGAVVNSEEHAMNIWLKQIVQISKIIDATIQLIGVLDSNVPSSQRFVTTVSNKSSEWLDNIAKKKESIMRHSGAKVIIQDLMGKILFLNSEILYFYNTMELTNKVHKLKILLGL